MKISRAIDICCTAYGINQYKIKTKKFKRTNLNVSIEPIKKTQKELIDEIYKQISWSHVRFPNIKTKRGLVIKYAQGVWNSYLKIQKEMKAKIDEAKQLEKQTSERTEKINKIRSF